MGEKSVIVVGKGHIGTILFDRLRKGGMYVAHWTDDLAKLDRPQLASCDVVVNCAGKTDLSWCEANKEECWRCNVVEPVMLQRRLPRRCKMVHLSSGCVWTGPYDEMDNAFGPNDNPTPACFYAWTKVACDDRLMAEAAREGRSLLVLRPRQVFSGAASPRNTLCKLMGYESLIDTPNSMTSASLIGDVVEAHVENSLLSDDQQVMCVYNRGITSPFKVGSMLAQAGLRADPKRMVKRNLDEWHKPRRVDVVMMDEEFESRIDAQSVEDAIWDSILELKDKMPPKHSQ